MKVLESRGDLSDMTSAIEEALVQEGVCLLGKGIFRVSGIDMPDGTTLMGGTK